jgi:hypothetical protein
VKKFVVAASLAVAMIIVLALPAGAVSETLRPSSGVNSGSSINVYSVLRVGSYLIVGGNFTTVVSTNGTSHAAGGLAALNASTGAWAWSASPGGTTYALGTDGTNVFAGGTYGLKRFSQSGGKQAFTAPYAVGDVRAITVSGSRVYYGGTNGVAAATTSGGAAWRVSTNSVHALGINGTQLLVGGAFCSIGGVGRPALASLNSSTGAVNTGFTAPAFACGTNGSGRPALAMAIANGRAFVGAGGTSNRVVAVNAASGATVWQGKVGDGDVQAVAIQGGSVYIGGHFDCVNGAQGAPCTTVRHKAAKYSTAGVLDGTWNPTFSSGFPGIWALTGDSSQLYVGGNFTRVNGAVRNKIAIFR